MSKATDTTRKAAGNAAKSQAIPAVLIGLGGVAILGYLGGNKLEDIFGGLLGGSTATGNGDKTSTVSEIIERTVSNTVKETSDSIIDSGVSAGSSIVKTVVSIPSGVYTGLTESWELQPSTVQTSKTKDAIAARTEQGQAWSLSEKSTDQLSKYVGTPGNVVSNWVEQLSGSSDLSGEGDTLSEYTQEEKANSKYSNPEGLSIAGLLTGSYFSSKESTLGSYSGQAKSGTGSSSSSSSKSKFSSEEESSKYASELASKINTSSSIVEAAKSGADTIIVGGTTYNLTSSTKSGSGTSSTYEKSSSSSSNSSNTGSSPGLTKYAKENNKKIVSVK